MKKKNFGLFLIFAATLFVATNSVLAAERCSNYASASAIYQAGIDGFVECAVTPEVVKVKVFEIALCDGRPDAEHTSSCSVVFKSDTGRDIEIAPGSVDNLVDEVSLPVGTYSHAYFVFGNEVSVKAKATFQFSATGANSSRGTVCWTVESRYTSGGDPSGNVECGASGVAEFSTEVTSYLGLDNIVGDDIEDDGDNLNDPVFSFMDVVASNGHPFDGYLLNQEGNLAQWTNEDLDENTSISTDAAKLMVVIQLTTATEIGPLTQSIDIGFGATDIVSFVMQPCDSQPESSCVGAGFIAGFDFYATAE